MYISKLKIKNFKCFDEVEINFDPNFNLIIGENNSGKSTIFDALRLWQLAFKEFLKDRTNNQQSSFRVTQNFSFTIDDIAFLRIIDFHNLFKNKTQGKFEITLTISINNEEVILPIIFISTTKEKVLNFELCKQPKQRPTVSRKISELLKIPLGSDFKELFLFTYINPIFLLPNKEPQYSKGYILNKLHEAKASEIIRNLLFVISPEKKKIKKEAKNNKLIEIESSIKDIMKLDDISFLKRLEDEESYIKIYAKNETLNTEVEINQLGSGTINVLNILSVLAYGDYEKINLNALLLDEPDSHLHFNHQSRLYNHLKKVSKDENKQIFIITHNSSLISQFENVLFIKNSEKIITPISLDNYLEKHLKDLDESHYNVIKDLSEAKKEKEKVETELNKITKPTLFCEGSSDVTILKEAFFKLYGVDFFNNEIEIIDGDNADRVTVKLAHHIQNDILLIGLLDADHVGFSKYKYLKNNEKFREVIPNIHLRKIYKKDNNSSEELTKTHLLMLPVPLFRSSIAEWYSNNLTIEYMFRDSSLEKVGVELDTIKGNIYTTIKSSIGQNGKADIDKEKGKIVQNIKKLNKSDFEEFYQLFENIAAIIGCKLPERLI